MKRLVGVRKVSDAHQGARHTARPQWPRQRDGYRSAMPTGPFDSRWLYWEAGHRRLLGRSSTPDYKPHVVRRQFVVGYLNRSHLRKETWSNLHSLSSPNMSARLDLMDRGCYAMYSLPTSATTACFSACRHRTAAVPTYQPAAQSYHGQRLGLGVEDLFHHVLAVLHDPAYREANAGALRMEWPRIPLSGLAGRRGHPTRRRNWRHPLLEGRKKLAASVGLGCPSSGSDSEGALQP